MPIYEYQCEDYSKVFSKLQKVSADPKVVVCPQCGSSHVDRLVSSFASGGSSSSSGYTSSAPSCSGFT